MKIDWRPLDTELEHWADGHTLPVWWRDDDAVARSPALDRLLEMSDKLGLPVHLAVIPARIDADLAACLRDDQRLIPVVHGWEHANHAPVGARKAEFGAHRPLPVMFGETVMARRRLAEVLGTEPASMFVPPWNRIAPDLLPHLREAGFSMVSTFGPRTATQAAPGLLRVNTHVDAIDWRGSRSVVDPDTLIARTAAQLADRRMGRADPDEPYGILTHHLVHDDAIWSLTGLILQRLTRGPVRVWTANGETAHEPT